VASSYTNCAIPAPEEYVRVQWDSVIGIYQSKMCDLVRREVMFIVLIDFDVPMKPIRLMKICVNETCWRIYVSQYMSDVFCIHSSLRKGDFLGAVGFHLMFRMCYLEGPRKL
jgi:hypothetical protein